MLSGEILCQLAGAPSKGSNHHQNHHHHHPPALGPNVADHSLADEYGNDQIKFKNLH
jgi:hypothetical protein